MNGIEKSDAAGPYPDEQYMRRAIELAKRGSGHVNPNPLVGAVIVRDGEILGEGWHEEYGELHAERNAIAHARAAGHRLEGSTIYVTLEPCCHYGKTPPCTEAIIEEGITTVVVGSDDSNPLVAGRGFRILREHGITVIPHFLKEECDAVNEVFFHYISTGRPYVAMKYAMTLDGKIACRTGDSRWVTGEEARNHVHRLRNHFKGIMAGIGTVLADDPMLNCRMKGGRDPVRIICDSHLRIPLESRLVQTAREQPVIVACLPGENRTKAKQLEKKGVTVRILLEVNVAEEESKFGFRLEDTEAAVREIALLPGIHICGLMTIAPFVENPEAAARSTRALFSPGLYLRFIVIWRPKYLAVRTRKLRWKAAARRWQRTPGCLNGAGSDSLERIFCWNTG